jgi:hypothetical protein
MYIRWEECEDGYFFLLEPQNRHPATAGFLLYFMTQDAQRYLKGQGPYRDDDVDFCAFGPRLEDGTGFCFVPHGAYSPLRSGAHVPRIVTGSQQGPLGASHFEFPLPARKAFSPCRVLRPVLGLAMTVARADGRLDASEVRLIRQVLSEEFELGPGDN